MLKFHRPILAASLLDEDVEHTDAEILKALEKLKYPVLATLKKDGIRALRLNDSLLSRTLKPIPNKSIRERSLILPGGFDMELWNPYLDYNEIQSIVMSHKHPDSDKIEFHILDWFSNAEYQDRTGLVQDWILDNTLDIIPYPLIHYCQNAIQLFNFFLDVERTEGEGICFRLPNSTYKQGRSTLKEQYLVKLARYSRQEVRIVGFIEQLENGNSEKRNDLGLMKRQTLSANMYSKNTLGSFKVQTLDGKQEFTVGSGLTDKLRKTIWEARDNYYGKLITIKHKPFGVKLKPRSLIFIGFRKEGF